MKSHTTSYDKFIMPLNMNGLQGRMLKLPPRGGKKRDILIIYGHNTKLEQCQNLANELAKYGSVTIPDLPGFGGMDSLYKLGEKPTLNRLADYMAAFVKLRYKRQRFVIVGLGFGFVIATRMLQRYPALAKRVDMVISLGGIVHYEDFIFSNRERQNYRHSAMLLSNWLSASIMQRTNTPSKLLERIYRTRDKDDKSKEIGVQILPEIQFNESISWKDSDLRTHMVTTAAMLNVDNCKTPIATSVWHAPLINQAIIDQRLVEQHLQVAYKDYHSLKMTTASKKKKTRSQASKNILPAQLRRVLANTKYK